MVREKKLSCEPDIENEFLLMEEFDWSYVLITVSVAFG